MLSIFKTKFFHKHLRTTDSENWAIECELTVKKHQKFNSNFLEENREPIDAISFKSNRLQVFRKKMSLKISQNSKENS